MRPFLHAALFTLVIVAIRAGASPESDGCARRMTGRQTRDTLPYLVDLNNPGVRLQASARKVSEESKALTQAIERNPSKNLNDSREVLAQIKRMADQDLIRYRSWMSRMHALLTLVRERSSKLRENVRKRIAPLNQLIADLPDEMSAYRITQEHKHYNDQPESAVKLFVQSEDLKARFANLMVKELNLTEFIKSLRSDPDVLASPDIQKWVAEAVFDGIEFLIHQQVRQTEDARGFAPEPEVYLPFFLRQTLPGWYRASNYFDAEGSADLTIRTSTPLLAELMRELISNGTEASRKRHPQEMNRDMDWKLFDANTRARLDANGDVLIEVEDHGDPGQYKEMLVLGGSSRNGVGIGRLRARLLADFLGYDLSYRAKPDGSGSVITVRVPVKDVVAAVRP